jgi:GxxExxY protein
LPAKEAHEKHEINEKKENKMPEIIYAEESYQIMGACFQVYKTMGCGFLEPVYQECVEIEFEEKGIPFVAQQELALVYQGHDLKHHYKADFVCYEKIIVEIKAVSCLTDEHRAQILNYLNATKFRLGLLINFGHHPKLESQRIVL